ncbi:hypothetical protein POMI540_1797 [Schizosaccharomyces pombe]
MFVNEKFIEDWCRETGEQVDHQLVCTVGEKSKEKICLLERTCSLEGLSTVLMSENFKDTLKDELKDCDSHLDRAANDSPSLSCILGNAND